MAMVPGMVDAAERRPLGRSGLSVAPLMLGGHVFGCTVDEPTGFRILDHFVARGFNALDTADYYSAFIPENHGGESESLIGNWLAQGGGRRDRVVIGTKLGFKMREGQEGLSRSYMMRAVEASLRRLRTDYIDLYQSHLPDERVPIEETLRGYEELMKSGKVRAIGASNYSAAQLEQAVETSRSQGLPRYETLQPWYNLYDRGGFEGDLAVFCHANDIAVIPYFGLASGFLTGKYRNEQDLARGRRGHEVRHYFTDRGLLVLAALDAVGAELRATPAQVALAWLMARTTAPIASVTSVAQLDDLFGATQLRLDATQMRRLDEASDPKGDVPMMTLPGNK